MSSIKRDLVLGYNHGYSWPQIAPFVDSLRASGFTGDIGLFTSGVAATVLSEIQSHGVITLESPYREMARQTSTSSLWKLIRFAPSELHPLLLQKISGIWTLRFFLYHRHLSQHGSVYRQVLLADIRDVVFQRNPFTDALAPGVHVFEEDGRHTIATRPINAGWVRESFGAAALEELGHLPILCAGTILGEAAELRAFLGHFCRTFTRALSLRPAGIDQGVFNVAVRNWRHPRLNVHKNGTATVLTMGIMNPTDILMNSSGWVTRPDGEVIPVLHQFDRHSELCEKIKVLHDHDWLGAWRKPLQAVPA